MTSPVTFCVAHLPWAIFYTNVRFIRICLVFQPIKLGNAYTKYTIKIVRVNYFYDSNNEYMWCSYIFMNIGIFYFVYILNIFNLILTIFIGRFFILLGFWDDNDKLITWNSVLMGISWLWEKWVGVYGDYPRWWHLRLVLIVFGKLIIWAEILQL